MSPLPALNSKLNLCVDIQHVSNHKIKNWHSIPWINDNCCIVVECEDASLQHPNILFYDFMWNRSKAYYTQRQWNYQPWYLYRPDNFLLQHTSQAQEKTRLFLSPNKSNTVFRQQLAELTKNQNGYINTLESNFINPDARCVSDIGSIPQQPHGYSPVHNAYYRETFFSIYTESIDSGTTIVVTEKTLDPLIKGHFVLPFSAPGFVKYLSTQGWRLPTFIDYSYDSIINDQHRFDAFSKEFHRLCSMDMDTWRQLWLDNIDIIEYNRNQLSNRPYDKLEILNGYST